MSNLHVQRIQIQNRIQCLQRPVLPSFHLLDDCVGHFRNQRRAHFHSVDLLQVPLDLPRAHPSRIHRYDFVVESRKSTLVLADDLRLERRVPVSRNLHHHFSPGRSPTSSHCSRSGRSPPFP